MYRSQIIKILEQRAVDNRFHLFVNLLTTIYRERHTEMFSVFFSECFCYLYWIVKIFLQSGLYVYLYEILKIIQSLLFLMSNVRIYTVTDLHGF